jgi:DNA-binding NtrC family response regulator
MGTTSRFRVLVVEDELLMRWSLAEALREAGHTVIEAGDGAAALRLLSDGDEVDAIVVDCPSDSNSTLELLEQIRRALPDALLILTTSFVTPAVIRAATRMGATGVLTKPFDVYGVGPVIQRACATREAADAITPLAR